MRDHVRILGILNIVWGGFICLGGLVLFLLFTGIAGAVGAAAEHGDREAAPWLALAGVVIGALFVVLGIPEVIAGWGVMNYRGWARILLIIISILHLPSIPIGTAIGVYGLWVLFNDETKRLFGISTPVGYAPPPVPPVR